MCNAPKEDLSKIISRVKKLLALSTSPNQHEAEQASVMAFELMAKYSIEMSTVEGALDNSIHREELLSTGRLDTVVWSINLILKKYSYVSLIKSRNRNEKKTTLSMLGKKHRIEVAKHVFEFLFNSVDRAWDVYRKTLTTSSKQETMDRKKHFSLGFLQGVTEKLEESKINLQEKGLVIVKDQELEDYLKGNSTTSKIAVRASLDRFSDRATGYNAGRQTDIFTPVKSSGHSHFKSIAS